MPRTSFSEKRPKKSKNCFHRQPEAIRNKCHASSNTFHWDFSPVPEQIRNSGKHEQRKILTNMLCSLNLGDSFCRGKRFASREAFALRVEIISTSSFCRGNRFAHIFNLSQSSCGPALNGLCHGVSQQSSGLWRDLMTRAKWKE